jgi:hypothetical protein
LVVVEIGFVSRLVQVVGFRRECEIGYSVDRIDGEVRGSLHTVA